MIETSLNGRSVKVTKDGQTRLGYIQGVYLNPEPIATSRVVLIVEVATTNKANELIECRLSQVTVIPGHAWTCLLNSEEAKQGG